MSGPQSWEEMRKGIKRRKLQVNQRNQQIRGLKGEIRELKKSIWWLVGWGEQVRKDFPMIPWPYGIEKIYEQINGYSHTEGRE